AEFADSHFRTARRYGFAAMLEEFRKSMLRELDYEQEARNLQTLATNLAAFPRIHVPQPVLDYTSSRVLTMDFVGGSKLTSLSPIARLEIEGVQLAEQLIACYLQQILVDGFFHADPHPGNVFLTDAGDVALLDLGMVGRVPHEAQEKLVKLLLGIGDGRGEDCARALTQLCDVDDEDELDDTAFRRRVGEIVAENQGVALADVRAGAVVLELTRAAVQSGLRPVPELSMLGRALLALDEVARSLNPQFDPNETIRRQAADIMRGRMAGSATQGSLFASMLEAKEFVEQLPGRVNRVMDALAEGELKLNVRGIDEREIMRGMHQSANRVTAGVVIAALIMGAALLMRVPTSARILGYPALAIICFLAAAGFGLVLLTNIWLSDRRTPPRRR
ncbi:MAG TPA: AarF/UbiB family protein, partial [Mycobacteriales bacterium]|nr:AarF/UbiB family protein [Mycobacteriales bacterium]